jgi:hypothetical protein
VVGGRGLATTTEGHTKQIRAWRSHRLVEGFGRCAYHPSEKGGEATGPNAVDGGGAGTKHHLVVDRRGIPLAATISAANVHDSKLFEKLDDSVEPVKGPRGRPRKRPDKLHADRGLRLPAPPAIFASPRHQRQACSPRSGGQPGTRSPPLGSAKGFGVAVPLLPGARCPLRAQGRHSVHKGR